MDRAEERIDRDRALAPEGSTATPSTTGVGVGGDVAAILALQRAIGNRATQRALRRRPALRRAGKPAVGGVMAPHAALLRQATATKKPARITLSFVPDKAMSAHEFAVRTWMQFFRLSAPEAERRVTEAEQHGGAGSGPHYQNGVGADEVGKQIKVGMDMETQTGEELEERAARAEELAHLPAAERSAVDIETDRRFWDRTGKEPGTKLTRGAGDAGNRELWLRTRDEVVHDRNRIEALPAKIHDFLLPDGKQVTPEQYAAVLRIADKLASFTDEDWALYQRRINARTDDYARLEESVNRFRAQQAAEAKVRDRVTGTESLYQQRQDFKALEQIAYKSVGGGAAPIQSPVFAKRMEAARAALESGLQAAHFKDVAEYDEACHQYLLLFLGRAKELALLALRASEQTVKAEYDRYQNAAEVQAVFDRLAPMRTAWKQGIDAAFRAQPTHHMGVGGGVAWDDPRTPAQQAAEAERVEKMKQVEAERQAQSVTSPILKDPELLSGVVGSMADPASLGRLLRDDARDRLADIAKTRGRIYEDPEAVLQFDRVVEMTLTELGAPAGSIGALIVRARMREIQEDSFLKGIALAVLAIGLGLLTFGGGTVAVLAGAGALGLSVYQASEEWEKYSNAFSAAHSAFDPSDALSSDEPTVMWLALSLIAVGFDGAALVNAMKAAAPAARVLAKGGELAEFDATLAKVTELSDGVKQSLSRSARAEKEFRAAAEDLSRYWRASAYSNGVLDPIYQAKVIKAAYYAAKDGIRKFELFLARLKLQKFMKGIDVEKLTAVELEAVEKAFKAGVAEFDAAVPAFTVEVKYASGTSKLTLGEKGELLLDGKLVGATEREEVLKQLGLAHANRGHGALRDPVTIANEALQNAAKPKGAGMSSIFSSDAAMLRSLEAAKADVAAGKGVASGARTLVDVPATPDVGRIFIAKSKLPAGVTPLNPQPFTALPGVAELPVTHVRALFSQPRAGVFQIEDIFPAFK